MSPTTSQIDDVVEDLAMALHSKLADEGLDFDDCKPIAHMLVRKGWTRRAPADTNVEARLDRLERWAQGSVVTW